MTTHSIYGGSSCHRWIACPGSVHLQKLAKEKPAGLSADRGTAMHNYAEKILTNQAVTTEGLSDDELSIVAGYIGAITDLEMGKTLNRKIEPMVFAPSIHVSSFGSIDYLAYEGSTKTMYIVDLKTGRSPVGAKGNLQLAYYVIAAMKTFAVSMPVKNLVLGIYQPATSSVIDWWMPSMEEINAIELKMVAAVLDNQLTPGDHCKYCKAEGICGVATDSIRGLVKTPVAVMSPQQIADTWDKLDQVEAWFKAVTLEADELAKTGALPDHHLAEGRARPLAWKEGVDAALALKQLGLDEAITHLPPAPPALKTPTQIAKAIGKNGASQLAAIAERPPSNMVIVRSTPNEEIRSLTDW